MLRTGAFKENYINKAGIELDLWGKRGEGKEIAVWRGGRRLERTNQDKNR